MEACCVPVHPTLDADSWLTKWSNPTCGGIFLLGKRMKLVVQIFLRYFQEYMVREESVKHTYGTGINLSESNMAST